MDPGLAELAHRIAEAARTAEDHRAFRAAALGELVALARADAGFFHALNPRAPLETGAYIGLEPSALAASLSRWDQFAVDLARWRQRALGAGGVAVDVEVFSPAERRRLEYFREVARPLGIRACALVHLEVRGRLVGAVALIRRRDPVFTAAQLGALRYLAPIVAVADALGAHGALAAPARPDRVRCVDTRLDPRERELVEHVALGLRNADIARAMGASPNTVRNRLAQIYRKLGAANRAELVRLAVLR